MATVSLLCTRIGSFSTTTATSKRAAKKQKVLWSKQQLLTCSFLFLYISLPSLHDCDLKLPQATFYGGHKHKPTNFSFSLNLVAVPKNSIPGKFTNIWDFTPIGIIATKFEKLRSLLNSDVLMLSSCEKDLCISKWRRWLTLYNESVFRGALSPRSFLNWPTLRMPCHFSFWSGGRSSDVTGLKKFGTDTGYQVLINTISSEPK